MQSNDFVESEKGSHQSNNGSPKEISNEKSFKFVDEDDESRKMRNIDYQSRKVYKNERSAPKFQFPDEPNNNVLENLSKETDSISDRFQMRPPKSASLESLYQSV